MFVCTLKYRVAKAMVVLRMVGMMMSDAHASETGLSPPELGSEPVKLSLPEIAPSHSDPSKLLKVFVGTSDLCCEGRTPIAGRYAYAGSVLTFSPAFGFEAGQTYVAWVQKPGHHETAVAFRIPARSPKIDAAVTGIFPFGDALLENTLRFYIHFSTPMTPHVAFNHIELRDASGQVDDADFTRLKQELWKKDRTRLTVLIDPGRIKRNVATNLDLGPALVAGRKYTLSVELGWASAYGRSVLPPFSNVFTVTHAFRDRPDTRLWQSNAPCLGTREPLIVTFDRPFDRHLLNMDIHVTQDENTIGGEIQVGKNEFSWSFTPNKPWTHKMLRVTANPTLEDVAGNNFRDLLDQSRQSDAIGASVT